MGFINEDSRPTSRLKDSYVRKTHRPIADPRLIQSALGNPIAIGYPTSPELGTTPSAHLRPQIIPSLKNTPPRPFSTDLRRPDTSNSNYSSSMEQRHVTKEPLSNGLLKRSETSQSNYSVPAERKDVVKELDDQISAQINELNQIFSESSSLNKKIDTSPTGKKEPRSPKENAKNLNADDKERIRALVKQRIREKKNSQTA